MSTSRLLDRRSRALAGPARMRPVCATVVVCSLGATASAGPGMIFVDAQASPGGDGTTWGTAYDSLQDGLADAAGVGIGIEVRVATGTYRPDFGAGVTAGDLSATFAIAGFVSVTGGWDAASGLRDIDANPTILTGDLSGNDGKGITGDNSHHVVTIEATGVLLSGCTVRGGTGLGTGNGGGILVMNDATAMIEDCTVTGNAAPGLGGGIYCGSFATVDMLRCTISDNTAPAGGGLAAFGAFLTVLNSTLHTNTASIDGGAAWISFEGGAAQPSGPVSSFVNCAFIGNSASEGGGGCATAGFVVLSCMNCAFLGNGAGASGGGVLGEGAPVQLCNTTVRQNTAPTGAQVQADLITVEYSNVEGGFAGIGNLDAAPEYVDAFGPDGVAFSGDEDHRLAPGSVNIDAGSVTAYGVDNPFVDLFGASRIASDNNVADTGESGALNFPIDIGPYEQQGAYTTYTAGEKGDFSDPGNWTNGVPSPANAAVFATPGLHEVNLTDDPTLLGMTVLGGEVSLENGGAMTLSEKLVVAAGSISIGSVPTFNASASVLPDGTLHLGVGLLDGTLTNAGRATVLRGSSIAGDLVARRGVQTGTLGARLSSNWAPMTIGGTVELAGELEIALGGGFDPPAGTMFDIFAAPQRSGEFEVVSFPGFDDGRFMRLVYDQAGPAGSATVIVDVLSAPIVFSAPEGFSFAGAGIAADVGDLDDDGDPDLAIALPDPTPGVPGSVIVLFNGDTPAPGWEGFDSSIQVTVGVNPSGLAIGELDGAPGLDIAVTNLDDDSVSILLNDGAGGLAVSNTLLGVVDMPRDVEVGDLDLDGDVDLAIVGLSFPEQSGPGDPGGLGLAVIYANQTIALGGVGFDPDETVGVGADPRDVDLGDLDNDKDLDMVTADFGGGTISAALNDGGDFDEPTESPVGNMPIAIVLSNLDNDKDLDLAGTNFGDASVSVLLNEGGAFADEVRLEVGAMPRSITALDADADGDEDLAVVADGDGGTAVVQILRNDTNGGAQVGFAEPFDIASTEEPLLVEDADMDGDGDDDLIAVNEEGVGLGPPGEDVFVYINLQCDEDATGDGVVDIADLNAVLTNFNSAVPPGTGGDTNGDGFVDVADLNAVLVAFGEVC